MWIYFTNGQEIEDIKDKTWMNYVPRGKIWIDSQTDKISKMFKGQNMDESSTCKNVDRFT